MERRHVLLVTLPAQGHINPALQFAKRLINMGIHVTFATTVSARRRMLETAATSGLTFAPFSDGNDDGYKIDGGDADKFMADIRTRGSTAVKDTISAAARDGRPVTCVVYTPLLPWASEVARELHVPSSLLWIQAATVLSVYYHYFHGLQSEIEANSDDPSWRIQIPGAPPLAKRDLPSFMDPTNSTSRDAYSFVLETLKEQHNELDRETKPKILINTLEALEEEALAAVDEYEMIAVGPLIPSAFLEGGDPSDKSFGGDLFGNPSNDYIEWLDSKPESSIVYVSFGSVLRLKKPQMEEIARGLLDSGRSFLWVIRANEDEKRDEEELTCLSDVERVGKIVPWCSQLEVLTHPSLGCFVTHCGWNSTLESLSCGVPVVAFPHWTDQGTNAKLIEDVWRNGVRVKYNEEGIVERGEIWRCVEEVMDGGERSREMRENAKRWKSLAREGVGESGSSTKNLKVFFEQVGVGH